MKNKKSQDKYLIELTGDQLLHLKLIVLRLIKGQTLKIGEDPKDLQHGKKLLAALEKPKRLK